MVILRSYWLPTVVLFLGCMAAWYGIPKEQLAIDQQLIGYPDSDRATHQLRLYLLGLLFFLPFLCCVGYRFLDTLDRYMVRVFLKALLICFGAFFIIMMLEDLQDNLSDFQQSEQGKALMLKHYIAKLPVLIVFILPYSLMLSLLWALGKMSQSREIVSIIQSGRSIFRFTYPLIGVGLICTIICLIFNYYWAPNAESKEDFILREATGRSLAEARDVAYQNRANTRHWLVGEFPYNHSSGEPLKYVEVTVLNHEHKAISKIISEEVTWSKSTQEWSFKSPVIFHLDSSGIANKSITFLEEDLIKQWEETPYQIINPGLKAPYLGIPGLISWFKNHVDNPLSDKRSYLTHFYYRIAQPCICLIIVLLAAPLGIVFNQRSRGGGVAVAIFLCAGMIFCSTVFPTLGESGHLPPLLAAWATNILFTLVALCLFHRRIVGRPIYQSLQKILSFKN